jgi:hypothetical protein
MPQEHLIVNYNMTLFIMIIKNKETSGIAIKFGFGQDEWSQ